MENPGRIQLMLSHSWTISFLVPLLQGVIAGGCSMMASELPFLSGKTMWLAYTFIMIIIPLYYYLCWGGTVWITNIVKVNCEANAQQCSSFIRDCKRLAIYEQQIDGVFVDNVTDAGCRVRMWGWWFGIPWVKWFTMEHAVDGGYRSELVCNDSLPMKMNGRYGFKLRKVSEKTTEIMHYQQVGWPLSLPFVCIVARTWSHWHLRTMEVSMQVLKLKI